MQSFVSQGLNILSILLFLLILILMLYIFKFGGLKFIFYVLLHFFCTYFQLILSKEYKLRENFASSSLALTHISPLTVYAIARSIRSKQKFVLRNLEIIVIYVDIGPRLELIFCFLSCKVHRPVENPLQFGTCWQLYT